MLGRILIVGLVIGGLGGALIGNCETKRIGESADQSVGERIANVVIETEPSIVTQSTLVHRIPRAVIRARRSDAKGLDSKSSEADAPKNSTMKSDNRIGPLLEAFNVTNVEDITIKGIKIFKSITRDQKDWLRTLIYNVRNYSHLNLRGIVDIEKKLHSKFEDDEVNFTAFNHLFSFVTAYVMEKISERNDAYRTDASKFINISNDTNERRKQFEEQITSETIESIDPLFNYFKKLTNEAESLRKQTDPQFQDKFTAAYHYFKHRRIPGNGKELSAVEYFDILRKMLCELKQIPEYKKLIKKGTSKMDYQKYYSDFRSRVRILLRQHNKVWNVVSFYFIDYVYGDQNGDAWINQKKLPNSKNI